MHGGGSSIGGGGGAALQHWFSVCSGREKGSASVSSEGGDFWERKQSSVLSSASQARSVLPQCGSGSKFRVETFDAPFSSTSSRLHDARVRLLGLFRLFDLVIPNFGSISRPLQSFQLVL